jgi:hypothetical protein
MDYLWPWQWLYAEGEDQEGEQMVVRLLFEPEGEVTPPLAITCSISGSPVVFRLVG